MSFAHADVLSFLLAVFLSFYIALSLCPFVHVSGLHVAMIRAHSMLFRRLGETAKKGKGRRRESKRTWVCLSQHSATWRHRLPPDCSICTVCYAFTAMWLQRWYQQRQIKSMLGRCGEADLGLSRLVCTEQDYYRVS